MSGGIYDGHRGGYSSNFDTYSTWKNNTPGLFNEYRIDGSWLDDGDYDKAFKGFPSHKTVNIFMGGTGYQEQSWGTTLLSGGIGFGITALGMWAMGLFGRGKAKADQPSTALNLGLPASGYWNSYFSNWKLPSLFGNGGASINVAGTAGNQTSTPATPATNNNQTTQQAQQTQQTTNAQQAPATNKASVGTAKNDILNTEKVHGKITDVGKNNEFGYPTTFKITDTTYSSGDEAKGNVYTYNFVEIDEKTKKPSYKLVSITYNAPHDKSNDISLNTYNIIDGITKGEKGADGQVAEALTMVTLADAPAMKNPGETGKGDTRFTYPPTK